MSINLPKLLGKNYKWWYLFRYSSKQYNLKISGYLLGSCSFLVDILTTIFVWQYLSKSNEIITYFYISFILQRLAWNSYLSEMWSSIINGSINSRLMLPTNIFGITLVKEIGSKIFVNLLSASLIFLLLPLYINNLILPSTVFLLLLPIFVVTAFFIDFGICLLLSSVAFVTNDVQSIGRMFFTIGVILCGAKFPFEVFSGFWFQFFVNNPYAWMSYRPMQIYLGKYNSFEILQSLVGGIVWCFMLFILARVLFKMGLKKNEAVGL